MAKTFIIKEAEAPENPKATLSGVVGGASGILDNTEYFYRIVGVGYRDFYYDTNYQAWLSPPSDEVSATSDATYKTIYQIGRAHV